MWVVCVNEGQHVRGKGWVSACRRAAAGDEPPHDVEAVIRSDYLH